MPHKTADVLFKENVHVLSELLCAGLCECKSKSATAEKRTRNQRLVTDINAAMQGRQPEPELITSATSTTTPGHAPGDEGKTKSPALLHTKATKIGQEAALLFKKNYLDEIKNK